MRNTPETIGLDGSGDYEHGLTCCWTPFPHVRHVGEFNRLTLNVDKDGLETVRFNDEIAWQGVYSLGLQAAHLALSGSGGWQTESRLTWAQVSVYAMAAATPTNQSELARR